MLACIAPAVAADAVSAPLLTRIPSHAAWTLLAGLGLVAVAVAALSVRRPPPRDGEPSAVRGSERIEPALARESSDVSEMPPRTPGVESQSTEASVAATVPEQQVPPAEADRPSVGDATAEPPTAPTTILREPSPTPARRASRPEAAASRAAQPSPLANGSQLFLALHHVDLSIEVLRKHLEREPRPMPAAWLMLLDLCRTHGREQTFSELALEFHSRFNVRTPAWEGFPPGREEPGLEAYPRLVKEITLTWGTHECRRLLDRLLYDTRNGERKGFTLNAYNDLIALRRAADAILDTIEQDLTEEARVRSAFDSASAAAANETPAADQTDVSPLVQDLESQLEGDLRGGSASQSAIEREHPALAGMLAREWGNAALSARLCEMLARGGDGIEPLSKEAAEELALLRTMAERLSVSTGVPLPGSVVAQES